MSVEATVIKVASEWALFIAGRRPSESDPDTNLRRLERYFQESYEFLSGYGSRSDEQDYGAGSYRDYSNVA
ncbi:MAG: hypothetical protein JSW38_09800 [Dehalococcoidia bacterium]|nr:MAG: hypothetical protein JSV02_05580 [Dehalococcoidia bacterium]UCG82476.1 MAG: hypothetical protein JSW38_09800 [Dehalococcoidia bacterium]